MQGYTDTTYYLLELKFDEHHDSFFIQEMGGITALQPNTLFGYGVCTPGVYLSPNGLVLQFNRTFGVFWDYNNNTACSWRLEGMTLQAGEPFVRLHFAHTHTHPDPHHTSVIVY